MKTLRAWGLKAAMLGVGILAVVGAWEVYQGTVPLTQQAHATPVVPELDHFECYRIREVEGARSPRQVELWNQFGSELVQLGGPRLLCVPTTMNFCEGNICLP